jgi:ribosome biogenesis GTPase / thiamine phosphate phosphatase
VSVLASTLEQLGWSAALAADHVPHAALGREPARIMAEDRGSYVVRTAAGERRAAITGRFRHEAGADPSVYPAVGDWVAIDGGPDDAAIHAVLARRTAIVRQAPGKRTEAQVVGANVDVVFIVVSLNLDLNMRRLERYLAVAWESGAEPVVLLSKADLVDDPTALLTEVERVAVGATILAISAIDGRGLDEVRARIGSGRTVAFVGSSGVGKSTLLNVLAGEDRAAVRDIREDDARGRHTTTRRQLHILPDGGLILDTPGMRELALWDPDGVEQSFPEIDELVATCRFGNCRHGGEPGCAVAAALASGALEHGRFEAWQKLEREALHHVRRVDALARAEERRKWKSISKSVSRHMDAKYGREGR